MFTASGLFLLLCVPSSGQPTESAKELKKLQGMWKVVEGEEVGTLVTAEEAKRGQEVFTFKGDTLNITRAGEPLGEFIVTVKPGKEAGEIDFKHKGGKYDGKVCHAIYALDGAVLKICTASKLRADKPEERPNVFSTKKSDKPSERPGKLLFVLKREKE